MRNIRIIVGLAAALTLVLAGYLTLAGFGVLGLPGLAAVKEVPPGHQEVAWIAPATSDEMWERLVASLRLLVEQWPTVFPESPPLQANLDKAFLDLTADVPEVGLYFTGYEDAVLWIRWYKLSSEMGTRTWMDRLARRQPAPLAILGGDTSDRAVAIGRVLQGSRDRWPGPAPLFLITTATADRYYPGDYQPGGTQEDDLTQRTWPLLMDLYKDRSFRFAFTNRRMADAIMEFVQQHPEIWTTVHGEPAFLAGICGTADPWTGLIRFAAGGHAQTPALYTMAWMDDRYSLDLAHRFAQVFQDRFHPGPELINQDLIPYGVGDFNIPSPNEARAAATFLANTARFRNQHQVLALPGNAQRARRFLRTLCGMAPVDTRNLAVVSGDAITFNTIYRDRDPAWNILDMPVPLVFFNHRNPMSKRAGFGRDIPEERRVAQTGTQDLLLYADIFQALILSAFQDRQLTDNPDTLQGRLRQTHWYKGQALNPGFGKTPAGAALLFNEAGDRNSHTGEHLVWLRPAFAGDLVLMQSTITVWRVPSDEPAGTWRLVELPLQVHYNSVGPQ